MSFYNTTHLKGDALKSAKKRADKSHEIVKDIFLKQPRGKGFTPYEILDRWPRGKRKPLITSVRRAMHTLTDTGVLQKLDETKMEREGAINHLWALKNTGGLETLSTGHLQLNI